MRLSDGHYFGDENCVTFNLIKCREIAADRKTVDMNARSEFQEFFFSAFTGNGSSVRDPGRDRIILLLLSLRVFIYAIASISVATSNVTGLSQKAERIYYAV